MEEKLLQGLSRLLSLTPEQRQHLRAAFDNIAADPGNAALPPTPVNLRVHLRPASELQMSASARRSAGAPVQPFSQLRDRISPRLKAKLLEIEPKILAWIRSEEQRGQEFAKDPVGTLQQAVPNLDPEILAEIRSIRASQQRMAAPLSGIEIKTITLDTKTSGA
jgi:hypothetical protein